MAELRIEGHIRFTFVTCHIRETASSYDGRRRATRISARNCTLDLGTALPVPRPPSLANRGTLADGRRAPRPLVAVAVAAAVAAVAEVAYEAATRMMTNCRCGTCFPCLSIIAIRLFTVKSPTTNSHKTKLY